ncbi:hypothetical protein [Enhygromyxa salina]|uniref:Uncharacterized protein n=1 Tax=Enhygromyxa salina TaxID=215803 RepID=A0A2S9YF94_9BACT|nr:hypothetical protein [Enhygromyxa salina]PRQ03780.1 hypothetical protein ENSA7_52470 [Enhygromyxa salina]
MSACPAEEAEECLGTVPDDPESLPTRALELGELHNRKFSSYQDGDVVEVETGGQGFQMITPYVEIPLMKGDSDTECWCISGQFVDEPIGPDAWNNEYCIGLTFEEVDGRMRVGPVISILDGSEPRGVPLLFQVRVAGQNFTASSTVELVLR